MSFIDDTKDKVTEYLKSIKVKVRSVVTPVIYLEYCLKFTIALDLKRLIVLRNLVLALNVIMILIRYFVPSLINMHALLLSLCYNIVVFYVIILWKKKQNRKTAPTFKKDLSKIKIKDIEIKAGELPERLKEFTK